MKRHLSVTVDEEVLDEIERRRGDLVPRSAIVNRLLRSAIAKPDL